MDGKIVSIENDTAIVRGSDENEYPVESRHLHGARQGDDVTFEPREGRDGPWAFNVRPKNKNRNQRDDKRRDEKRDSRLDVEWKQLAPETIGNFGGEVELIRIPLGILFRDGKGPRSGILVGLRANNNDVALPVPNPTTAANGMVYFEVYVLSDSLEVDFACVASWGSQHRMFSWHWQLGEYKDEGIESIEAQVVSDDTVRLITSKKDGNHTKGIVLVECAKSDIEVVGYGKGRSVEVEVDKVRLLQIKPATVGNHEIWFRSKDDPTKHTKDAVTLEVKAPKKVIIDVVESHAPQGKYLDLKIVEEGKPEVGLARKLRFASKKGGTITINFIGLPLPAITGTSGEFDITGPVRLHVVVDTLGTQAWGGDTIEISDADQKAENKNLYIPRFG